MKLQVITIFICLSIGLLGCNPEPEPIAQVQETPISTGIEVIEIHEEKTLPFNISQEKTFDQCASASPFKAEIQFSQSTGQEAQQALVLTASVGGEAGISPVAKLTIGTAMQSHFSNKQIESQGHAESVSIEVPPNVHQKYTIIWQESRREGSVEYIENGESKTVSYSYRIGIEFLSSTVVDLECPKSESHSSISVATDAVYPTHTPLPIYNSVSATPISPTSTSTPALVNTPLDSILTVGEKWQAEGRELLLNNYKFESNRIRFEIRFTNATGNTIIFDISTESFVITDNLGRRYTASYPLGCGSGGAYKLTLTLESGETKDCNVYFNSVDYANLQVNQLIFSVTASVFQNARWQIPIQH